MGGAPAIVVIGEDADILTGGHGKAISILPNSASQHNARAVVILESDGAFDRPRRQNRTFGIHSPQNLSCARLVRFMFTNPFKRAINTMVISAINGGACHHPNIRHRG